MSTFCGFRSVESYCSYYYGLEYGGGDRLPPAVLASRLGLRPVERA